jgi:hypothetical protein
MPRRTAKRDPIPDDFDTLEAFWDFWDTHSLADYEDQLTPVECRVNLLRRSRMVPVEPELLGEVAAYARTRGVSCETLVNLWLRDAVSARAAQKTSVEGRGSRRTSKVATS